MPDTFEINQGARIIFSIVSFPFLSLFPADESLSHRLFPNEDIHAVDQAEWMHQSR
jgi:hypothetical protein